MLASLDLLLIGKLMGAELLAGAAIGLIFKLFVKIRADGDRNLQTFSAADYSSPHFGTELPKNAFDAFSLSPEFVIVKTSDSNLLSERYVGFFGSYSQATYENGKYRDHEYSALTSPMYLCVVFIPIVVGFFSLFLSMSNDITNALFCSGVVWMFVTTVMINIGAVISTDQRSDE